MYHSIQFGDKNTYDDWHIIPSSRPVVAAPQPKLILEEVPGSSTVLDLTETLTGLVEYYDRSGSFEFIVENGHQPWEELYSEILNYLQGHRMRMVLEDDPNYYYEGRFALNEWRSEKNWSRITIDYRVKPYKYEVHETGHIEDTLVENEPKLISIRDLHMPVVPLITCANPAVVTYAGRTFNLPAGTSNIIALKYMGNIQNELIFTGSGPITITYNNGRL